MRVAPGDPEQRAALSSVGEDEALGEDGVPRVSQQRTQRRALVEAEHPHNLLEETPSASRVFADTGPSGVLEFRLQVDAAAAHCT